MNSGATFPFTLSYRVEQKESIDVLLRLLYVSDTEKKFSFGSFPRLFVMSSKDRTAREQFLKSLAGLGLKI
jgi:hypothetical protein